MFDDFSLPVKFFFAFAIVLGLIGVTAWVVRRFGADRLGATATRGRQPRLAVIDATAVDGRRRLILIRRDNIEHLLMIGGPTDVVVELNIVRTASAAREAAPSRVAAADALPRAVPLGEGNMWPLQPQAEPAPRQARPAALPDDAVPWPIEPETAAPPPPPRQTRPPIDPLAGLAAELSRQPEPAPRPARQREPERMREPPPPAPTPEQIGASADQNLAEMAHRLEAALRRPGAKGEARPPEPAAEPAPPAPTVRAEPKPGRSEPKPPKSLYDSLEQEMASLLGRPNDKT